MYEHMEHFITAFIIVRVVVKKTHQNHQLGIKVMLKSPCNDEKNAHFRVHHNPSYFGSKLCFQWLYHTKKN